MVDLRDALVLIWMRLTHCRKHGHYYKGDSETCLNCAKPWSGFKITRV